LSFSSMAFVAKSIRLISLSPFQLFFERWSIKCPKQYF
jgi:hypothetical protein